MRRREFITLMGSAAAWPLMARAQQGEGMRRIGVLSSGGAVDDSETKTFLAAFRQGLEQLGWTEGRNVQIDARFGQADADRVRKYAAELVALTPNVILTSGAPATEQMIKTTQTVPIVFVVVPDPVGSGFVDSLSQPGGNATGFLQFEYSLSGKWLELLKQIAPAVTRAAVLWEPSIAASIGQPHGPVRGRANRLSIRETAEWRTDNNGRCHYI